MAPMTIVIALNKLIFLAVSVLTVIDISGEEVCPNLSKLFIEWYVLYIIIGIYL